MCEPNHTANTKIVNKTQPHYMYIYMQCVCACVYEYICCVCVYIRKWVRA